MIVGDIYFRIDKVHCVWGNCKHFCFNFRFSLFVVLHFVSVLVYYSVSQKMTVAINMT